MLIQKELEAKVIAALQTKLTAKSITGVQVKGSWQPVASGLVRWIESDTQSVACLNLAVGTPQHEQYTTPVLSFACNLTLFVRYELDPTGATMNAVCEAVQELLDSWQEDTYQQAFTALDFTELSVDNVSVGAGASPVVNSANAVCSVTWPITLSGSRRDSETSQDSGE